MRYLILLIFLVGCTNNFVLNDNISPEVLFCPKDNCSQRFIELTENAKSVKCAFYDIDLNEMIENIDELIVESDNNIENAIQDKNSALMHNKFCIIDDILWTGSFNPTFNGNYRNNNNVVIVKSEFLLQNHLDEFNEMKSGTYGKGEKVKYSKGENWENYFCPEDNCKEKVLGVLDEAKNNVYFMTFSFTDAEIASKLVEISDFVYVEGLMEAKRVGMSYNQYSSMKDHFLINLDSNPWTMHHKVFVIDEEIVITGSYNPTKNANERNDENLLIIRDKSVAKLFLKEFYDLSQ